jgi:PAS domain S-box-containing protein
VENASDLVFACDRQLQLTYVSPNSRTILGYPADSMIGETLDSLVHPNDLPALWARAERTKESRRPQAPLEFRVRHKSGGTRWFVSALAPLEGPDGEVVGLTGTAHDISEEKAAIERLECANQNLRDAQLALLHSEKMASLGMLMAGLAHEIRTPIAAVSSTHETIDRALAKLAQCLETHYADAMRDPRVKRLMAVLSDSTRVVGDGSRRVLGIVERLRKFSCSDETQMVAVDLNAIAEDTLALLHHELKHHVVVDRRLGQDATVVGSPSRLNQVFVNLLVNAGHAIRARGRGKITLSTRGFADHAEIEVKDDGIGIAPEHLDQVFTSGFTTKKAEGGSGLGLAISREIVDAHAGSIEVESELGVGTTFRVRLPKRRLDCSECPTKAHDERR